MLVDGDGVIYESAMINEYLDEKFPEVPLMPRNQLDRAKVRIWVDFFNTRVHPTGSDLQKDRDPEKARARMAQHLRTIDEALAGKEYLVGDQYLAGGYNVHPLLHPARALQGQRSTTIPTSSVGRRI